ncbi:hypothetical protein BDV27DRAFT_127534, partial [Aspergillus caelatus]
MPLCLIPPDFPVFHHARMFPYPSTVPSHSFRFQTPPHLLFSSFLALILVFAPTMVSLGLKVQCSM